MTLLFCSLATETPRGEGIYPRSPDWNVNLLTWNNRIPPLPPLNFSPWCLNPLPGSPLSWLPPHRSSLRLWLTRMPRRGVQQTPLPSQGLYSKHLLPIAHCSLPLHPDFAGTRDRLSSSRLRGLPGDSHTQIRIGSDHSYHLDRKRLSIFTVPYSWHCSADAHGDPQITCFMPGRRLSRDRVAVYHHPVANLCNRREATVSFPFWRTSEATYDTRQSVVLWVSSFL